MKWFASSHIDGYWPEYVELSDGVLMRVGGNAQSSIYMRVSVSGNR